MTWIRALSLVPVVLLALPGCSSSSVEDERPADAEVAQEAGPLPASVASLPTLTPGLAERLAGLALHCIGTEYPNKPGHVLAGPEDVLSPRQLHPSFYGCFDWHSAVHGHWALARQLRVVEGLAVAGDIREALSAHLSADSIAAELAYLRQPHHRTFERPYGWAWLLRLAAELHAWDDPDARRWREDLRPLEEEIVRKLTAYLPLQNYPVRVGTHTNTAFALAHALDYARTVGDEELAALLERRSRDYFLQDTGCPAAYEPSGTDFLSPCLEEADLMRRVLPADEFESWLSAFLPDPAGPGMASLREPAVVLDLSDPYLVHLVGLNLSRAWCYTGIAADLPASSPARPVFQAAGATHAEAGLGQIFTDEYGGEHWLATYAVYLLTGDASSSQR